MKKKFSIEIKKVPWREYRDKLLPILEETETKNNHLFAEQVDKALSNDKAFLFVSLDGFFVLRPIIMDGAIYNEVMFAFSFTSHSTIKSQPLIEEMTLNIGGKGVIVYTVHKVYARLLPRMGYKHTSTKDNVMMFIKEI